jgi:hypothetical protein
LEAPMLSRADMTGRIKIKTNCAGIGAAVILLYRQTRCFISTPT